MCFPFRFKTLPNEYHCLMMIPPFLLLSILSPLVLPRRVVVLDFGDELGGEDVDLLVGAVEQAQRPELACRRRVVVSGRFGFLAAVCGLQGCDFGGLGGRDRCERTLPLVPLLVCIAYSNWGQAYLLPVVQALVVVL